MCDLPSVFESRIRTARKEHKCCECHRSILPGERYEWAKGCWNGKWDKYQSCLACSELRDEIVSCHRYDEPPAFEELHIWAKEDGYKWPPEKT